MFNFAVKWGLIAIRKAEDRNEGGRNRSNYVLMSSNVALMARYGVCVHTDRL